MRKRFVLAIAVGLLTALLAGPGTALARAQFTEYTGTETYVRGGPIFDGVDLTKPVVHFEVESVWDDVTTDARTTGRTYVSGKLTVTDMATFTGVMSGTSLTVVDNDEYEGTWEGRWQGKLINGVGFFTAVAHGTGDLAGMKMKADFTGTEVLGPVKMEGRILDPHGS